MKKVLLLLLPLLSFGLINKLNAQCTPYNFQSIIKNINVVGPTATATLDVSFDIKANNGNKYIFIHLWTGTDYQAVTFNWAASGQKAPSPTDLNGVGDSHKTLYNLAIDNNVIPQTYKSAYVYPAMALDQPATPPMVTHLSNGADSFYITDIVVSFPSSQLDALGDIIQGAIWSSNSNNYSSSMSIQCYLAGATFLADPVISGNIQCQNYTINITHNSLAQNDILSGSYNVYVDANGNGLYNAGTDVQVDGPVSFNITASTQQGNYYTNSITNGGSLPWQYKGRNLFVVLTSGAASLTKFIPAAQCATLPVTFKSFTVARNNQTVAIKWETAFEQNNRGFYVQRNVNGEWKDVAFVFSKADGGNSSEPLSYVYNDANNLNSVSYYRVLQVDLSGLGKYSEVRVVRGEELTSKLMLFPNPGTNGKVNVIFQDESSAKSVIVYDATGRAVKTLKNIVGSSLTIEQLTPGVYNIQVINTASQTVTSGKFIIKD